MTIFQATVIWPGKDFDNKHGGEGAKRTSATFLPAGLKDEKDNYVKVNSSNPESSKGRLLKKLKKGQTVYLIHSGDYEGNPYFDVAQFKGSGLLPPTDGATAPVGSGDSVADSGDVIDSRTDTYVATYVKLIEKFETLQIQVSEDTLSMMAASIAKQI